MPDPHAADVAGARAHLRRVCTVARWHMPQLGMVARTMARVLLGWAMVASAGTGAPAHATGGGARAHIGDAHSNLLTAQQQQQQHYLGGLCRAVRQCIIFTSLPSVWCTSTCDSLPDCDWGHKVLC